MHRHTRIMRRTLVLGMSAAVFVFLWTAMAAASEGTIARGGKLYDKWYKIADGAERPKGTHPAWPSSNTKKKGSTTYRCKSCHGWDYLGKDGAYASGSYKTGISGVRGFDGGDAIKVVAVLKDANHGFGGKMADADINALALFVTRGQVDMDRYIDRETRKFKGDVAKGRDYFNTICANCHGVDGKLPKDMPQLGILSNSNPWEVMHKALNGQPGEGMPGLRALPIQVTLDIGAYAQTLPKD